MPKGQFSKMKGAICNIPIDVNDTCNVFPRPASANGLILMKLEFKGHVYFQTVSPEKVHSALTYLKLNNPLYSDITIDYINQIQEELLNFDEEDEICIEFEKEESHEETLENPYLEHRQSAD